MKTITGPAANAILRQIAALARSDGVDRQKPIIIMEAVRSVDWASLTFVGQRHEFDLRLEGDADAVAAALAVLEADLGDSEIPLAGAFVADIKLCAGSLSRCGAAGRPTFVSQSLRIEALSIRD